MTLLVPPPAGAVGMLTDVTVAQDAFARALENLTLASAHRREALRAARSMSRGARACGERLARDVPRGRIGVATAVGGPRVQDDAVRVRVVGVHAQKRV